MIDKDLCNRVKFVREDIKQLSKASFAEMLGIKRTTLSNIESYLREPSKEMIKLLLTKCDISADWLLTGKGEMFLYNKEEKREKAVLKNPEGTTLIDSERSLLKKKVLLNDFENTVSIPVYGKIACGTPNAITHWQSKFVEVPKNLIQGDKAQYHIMIANGDSMEPIIIHQDALLIKETKVWEDARGKVAAVMIAGETTLKKVEILDKFKVTILKPFNLEFKEMFLDKEDLQEVTLVGVLKAQLRLY